MNKFSQVLYKADQVTSLYRELPSDKAKTFEPLLHEVLDNLRNFSLDMVEDTTMADSTILEYVDNILEQLLVQLSQ